MAFEVIYLVSILAYMPRLASGRCRQLHGPMYHPDMLGNLCKPCPEHSWAFWSVVVRGRWPRAGRTSPLFCWNDLVSATWGWLCSRSWSEQQRTRLGYTVGSSSSIVPCHWPFRKSLLVDVGRKVYGYQTTWSKSERCQTVLHRSPTLTVLLV